MTKRTPEYPPLQMLTRDSPQYVALVANPGYRQLLLHVGNYLPRTAPSPYRSETKRSPRRIFGISDWFW